MTEPFIDLSARFATNEGAPGYELVALPHPISSRTLDELADRAVSAVLARLTARSESGVAATA